MWPHRWQPTRLPRSWILQERTLECVAISFSSAWKWKVKVKLLSCVQLFVTPWTAAYQAPPSVVFSRQEHWSAVPLPSPVHLENSAVATGLKKVSFHSSPKERQCQRMLKLPHNCTISHASKVMLKIIQARLQQYMNHELPDVQAGFRKARERMALKHV